MRIGIGAGGTGIADATGIAGATGTSQNVRLSSAAARPRLRAPMPSAGVCFFPMKKAARNARAGSPSFSGLKADLYESADGLRPGRKIVLAAPPIVDFGEHRIMPAHSDLSTGAGRLGAASWLFGNTN
jgi:hypothetical protein